jgi:undecaprenyl-diphosphatase
MELYQAVILAIVQGLTEFLPISSSAHLILVPEVLGWQASGLAFDVAVHVGTLLAVMVYLRKEIGQVIPAWLGGWRGFSWNNDGQLGWWVVVATIPVGLVGLLAGDIIEQHLRTPLIIAATTLGFGLLLGWADSSGDKNAEQLASVTLKQSLIVGAAQALALIPGTSRSGITMTAMLALGYSRVAAAKFSFLLSVPAIALPGLLKTAELASSDQAVAWDILIIGAAVSAIVAFLCIHWFINLIQRVGMRPFVFYRVLLAIVIVVLLVGQA